MTLLPIVVAANLAAPATGFEFDADGAANKFGRFTLGDLTVGDTGRFARFGAVCVSEGRLLAIADAKITDQSYGPMWQFTVLPGRSVSATIVGEDGEDPAQDDLRDFIETSIFQMPDCESYARYFATIGGLFMEVKTVNGASRLSELLDQINE